MPRISAGPDLVPLGSSPWRRLLSLLVSVMAVAGLLGLASYYWVQIPIVKCLKREPDGDIHIRLRVDPQYAGLLAPANGLQTCVDHSGPHLVVEIIPQHSQGIIFRTNNADAGGFVDPPVPSPGDHITVTGPYVIDTNSLHRILYQGQPAENWAEIHPAWAIGVDASGSPGSPNQFGPEFGESGS